jgi:hypothetical protein
VTGSIGVFALQPVLQGFTDRSADRDELRRGQTPTSHDRALDRGAPPDHQRGVDTSTISSSEYRRARDPGQKCSGSRAGASGARRTLGPEARGQAGRDHRSDRRAKSLAGPAGEPADPRFPRSGRSSRRSRGTSASGRGGAGGGGCSLISKYGTSSPTHRIRGSIGRTCLL